MKTSFDKAAFERNPMQALSRFGIDIPVELQGITRIRSSKVLECPPPLAIFRASLTGEKVEIKFVDYVEIVEYEPDEDSKKSYGSAEYGGESIVMGADARLSVVTKTIQCNVSNVSLDRENVLTFEGRYGYSYEANYNAPGYAEHGYRFTVLPNSAEYKPI